MADFPNLAGVATKDLVETIGSGNFKASYINWSRTLNLLRQHAPGWMPTCVPSSDGSLLHRAPVGAYLLVQFEHLDGTCTTAVPQAIMDNRNSAIPFDKITARDITDTQRRGACMAAAMLFGLAYELWAKMPLENGYSEGQGSDVEQVAAPVQKQSTQKPKEQSVTKKASPRTQPTQESTEKPSEADFRAACTEIGLIQEAVDQLVELINGDYEKGIKTLKTKTPEWVEEQNAPFAW